MTPQELLGRISSDPNVCGGNPCIRGYRIWVSLILDFLASGMTSEDILKDYPQLTAEDVRACVAYALESISRKDPIVEDGNEVREVIAKNAAYDLDGIVDEARACQEV